MSVDLHIHTTASDGDIDPVTVVRMAARAGLQIIALADHESTSGFYPAFAEGQLHGITVIPAVELMTFYKNKEVHVLGYLTDPENREFQREIAELRDQRTKCAEKTVRKLREFGFMISWDDVKTLVHPNSPVSKGHIMQAINNAGYIKDKADALNVLQTYLNREGLAYICHTFAFEDAVELIKRAGGIPVLAHPGLIMDDIIVGELCDLGIEGIEVFYWYFGPRKDELIIKYNLKAEDKKLLKTGGSDYHGTITPVTLGDNTVHIESVKAFLETLGVL